MQLDIVPGKYVVAVSGGVDSMVLLDLLASHPGVELVVAHFEHGIRDDSDDDRQLVGQTAQRYGLPFVYEHGNLGPKVSEATARAARYAFLRRVQAEQGAAAIVTAHHQDDVIETAIINLVRGTGPRGLSSLKSTGDIVRPLLGIPKVDLLAYANEHHVMWHEDSTNSDDRYLRNYIRRYVVARMTPAQRAGFLSHIATAANQNQEIDKLVQGLGSRQEQGGGLARSWFIMLPYDVSCTVLAEWLRQEGAQFDRKTINRLVVFAKTAQAGKRADVDAGHIMEAGKKHITLHARV